MASRPAVIVVGAGPTGLPAAHIHSPAGGQAMNTGLQDAFNLPSWWPAGTVRVLVTDRDTSRSFAVLAG